MYSVAFKITIRRGLGLRGLISALTYRNLPLNWGRGGRLVWVRPCQQVFRRGARGREASSGGAGRRHFLCFSGPGRVEGLNYRARVFLLLVAQCRWLIWGCLSAAPLFFFAQWHISEVILWRVYCVRVREIRQFVLIYSTLGRNSHELTVSCGPACIPALVDVGNVLFPKLHSSPTRGHRQLQTAWWQTLCPGWKKLHSLKSERMHLHHSVKSKQ